MATQARSARVTTVGETRDLATFIRTESPPSFRQGDGTLPVAFKWKKAFAHPEALNKSRAGLTTMWHDCTSLIGLGSLFKLDVKELDSSFQPIRAAQKTTAAGSKYMAIKPTRGYRSSTQPRPISRVPTSRARPIPIEQQRNDTGKEVNLKSLRQSPESFERADSCVESNKEAVLPGAGLNTAALSTSNDQVFEVEGSIKESGNYRPRNSFSSRSWVHPTVETLDNSTVRSGGERSTLNGSFRPHSRSGGTLYNEKWRLPVDQTRPNSSPQESTRVRGSPKSTAEAKFSSNNSRQGQRLTPPGVRRGSDRDLSLVDPWTGAVIPSAQAIEQDRTLDKPRAHSEGRSLSARSPRHSPDHSVEKQISSIRSNPTNRPRRTGTSKSEKGRRMTSATPPRPRALSGQLGYATKPPDSPMEPVPPIPPPQLEVKQDLLLEALPPLDVPATAAVEEMITESRASVRKLKMQNIWPDTPTSCQRYEDSTSLPDETSDLSRLERENARLRAILYMYVVDPMH